MLTKGFDTDELDGKSLEVFANYQDSMNANFTNFILQRQIIFEPWTVIFLYPVISNFALMNIIYYN